MGLRKVRGHLIKKMRDGRPPSLIIERMPHKVTRTTIHQWEKEEWSPTEQNILSLITALGCTYEDISEPVEPETVAA